jgi:hypothetical protein
MLGEFKDDLKNKLVNVLGENFVRELILQMKLPRSNSWILYLFIPYLKI